MRQLYFIILLFAVGLQLQAQPDPNHKETMASALRYELGLSDEQVNTLEAAEEEFLKDYHLGIIRFNSVEEHQKGYFDHFRPLLDPPQQLKLDQYVQQYEEMLQGMKDRKIAKGIKSTRKRFADLYLTDAQIDSLYYAMLLPEATKKQKTVDRRAMKRKLDATREERVKAVLNPKQFKRYQSIVAEEEVLVLNMQADFIQSQYPGLQLTLEQAKAIHEFQSFDEGLAEDGTFLGYWEKQDQRYAFMQGLLNPLQLDNFKILQDVQIRKYEQSLDITDISIQEQIDYSKKRLDFTQTTTLPKLTAIRLAISEQLSKADEKSIARLRQHYLEQFKAKARSIEEKHEKNYRNYKLESLEIQLTDLHNDLFVPNITFLLEHANDKIQGQIESLTNQYLPLVNQHQDAIQQIDQNSHQFERDNFVLPGNWFTTLKTFPEKSEAQINQEKVMRLLLLFPDLKENLKYGENWNSGSGRNN